MCVQVILFSKILTQEFIYSFWILGCPVLSIYMYLCQIAFSRRLYDMSVSIINRKKSRTIIAYVLKRNYRTRDLNSVTVFNIKWVFSMGFYTGIMYLVIIFVIILSW